MIRLIYCALLVAFLSMGGMDVMAGSHDSTPSASQSQTTSELSLIDRVSVWVLGQQREFHRRLTDDIRGLVADSGNWALVWSLVVGSFLYGVFHALGPGHGKAVVSGYLLTHRQTIRRGVGLAVAASICQGMVAIFIVYGLVNLAGLLPRDTQVAVTWGERASFILVTLLGAYLALSAIRRLISRRQSKHLHTSEHAHSHEHDHSEADTSCGHTHVPTMQQIESATDLKSMIAVILSIGVRPCTGAIIVLVFASIASLHWVGIVAVLAMSIGTAITVSIMAFFVGTVRENLDRLSWVNRRYAAYIVDIIAISGGIVILMIGITLISSSFLPQHPLVGM